ncbi:MAG TPA: hypothetical protein VEC06_10980 [Paucimonas sp.]|nr:hypothetical protein [Paucimonas sp.]
MSKLILSTAPAGAVEMVRADLKNIAPGEYGGTRFEGAHAKTLDVGLHHRVYELDLSGGPGYSKAENCIANGSGFLVRSGGDMVAVAYVGTDAHGKKALGVKEITFGPFVGNFTSAVRDAEEALPGGEHELRLLRISGLSLDLLWLAPKHRRHGGEQDDCFWPVNPVPEYLEYRRYTADDLNAALAPACRELLKTAARSGAGPDAVEC